MKILFWKPWRAAILSTHIEKVIALITKQRLILVTLFLSQFKFNDKFILLSSKSK